jgi:hypothetical protein
MRHRLALVAQTLWAVVDGVASLRTTHGSRSREAKAKEQE